MSSSVLLIAFFVMVSAMLGTAVGLPPFPQNSSTLEGETGERSSRSCTYDYWKGYKWIVPSKYTLKVNYISTSGACASLCCQDPNCAIFSWKKNTCFKHNASPSDTRYKLSKKWTMGNTLVR